MWRVAHESARYNGFPAGPYACSDALPTRSVSILFHMGLEHSGTDHPSPYADPALRGIADFERCGFESREALNAWFDGWSEALDEAGMRVWVYDVPDWCARSGFAGQVVFDALEAVEVDAYAFEPEQLSLF
ncbi:hypothetical protein TG1_34 [Streptomyces phage TG1]|uniref:Uncharacterized protein n=1 Tax=Streptomyces phage TG1 TaxID=2927987 RepID=K4IBP7_9CAUD|nr:hypothetical protein D281_gp34 [Streptomyces phage TG1]AFU62229.1 hypothetical protein TG1_34 [Streptomyces phage TG1]